MFPFETPALDPLRRAVEQRIAGSVDHKRMDTRDARTLWFLRFLGNHNINEIDFLANENRDEIMACYTVSLFDGNTIQGKAIKTATIKGYIQAVNDFCVANQQEAAVNFKMPASKVVRLLNDQAKFE
jgi:hypothetical protein